MIMIIISNDSFSQPMAHHQPMVNAIIIMANDRCNDHDSYGYR